MGLPELVFRIAVTILVLLVMARLDGPKQISQMNFYDYVVGIAAGSLAASASLDASVPIQNGLVAIALYLLSGILMSWLARKNLTLRRFLSGKPIVLIARGQIQWEGLKRARMNVNELQSNLRYGGYFDLSEVESAVLEPTGKVSVQPKGRARPPKAADLNLPATDPSLSANVIVDGAVLRGNLEAYQKDEAWLIKELKKQRIGEMTEIALATLDAKGTLTVYLKDHNPSKRVSFL